MDTTRRLRWWQFSLRAVIYVMLLVGVCLGGYLSGRASRSSEIEQLRAERDRALTERDDLSEEVRRLERELIKEIIE